MQKPQQKAKQFKRLAVCGVRDRTARVYHSPVEADGRAACGGTDPLRGLLWKSLTEAVHMRVVVIKSPKLFGGLLRKLFGIEKMPRDLQ